MKVLYIVTAYDRHPGDVITPWLVETIRGLRVRGVEVEVLAPAYRGQPGGWIEGVRVHRFRYAPRWWEDLTHDQTAPDRVREKPWYLALVPGYVLSGMWAAWRLARRGGFDVVHVHWPIPHALLGLAARRAGGQPLVCTFHGVELTWTRHQLRALLPFLRYVIRTADAVTANSTYTAGMIRAVEDRRVEIVPFGATVDVPATIAEPRVRGRGEPFELLFVGRLVERKGVHVLLEALPRVLERQQVRLRIVGDGPLRRQLERQAERLGLKDVVRFEGFVTAEALARAFAECDAFVLPAVVDRKGDTEGLGVVLLEALGYGKPVVASAAGGIVDVIRHEQTGLLVPPGDAGALAAAIERLAADSELGRELGRGGRAHLEREFSWPVILDRLVGLYRRLTGVADVASADTGTGEQSWNAGH